MINYNTEASLQEIDNPTKEQLEIEIINKSPIIINNSDNKINLNLELINKLKPGYIINDNNSLISFEELLKSDNFTIIKNKNIIKDFNLNSSIDRIDNLIDNVFMCGKESSITLHKGSYNSPLYKNYREYMIIKILTGNIKLYLFNPKHETDIKGKEIKSIKKWGIPINMTSEYIYIPPEWYYCYQLEDEAVLINYEADTYSTYLYNYLRKK